MSRHHSDPDSAFYGWYESWMQPGFRAWNIEDEVGRVRVPMTVIQGLDDEYGTGEQVERIRRAARAPADAILLPGCGHAPQRDQPETVLNAIRDLLTRPSPRRGTWP